MTEYDQNTSHQKESEHIPSIYPDVSAPGMFVTTPGLIQLGAARSHAIATGPTSHHAHSSSPSHNPHSHAHEPTRRIPAPPAHFTRADTPKNHHWRRALRIFHGARLGHSWRMSYSQQRPGALVKRQLDNAVTVRQTGISYIEGCQKKRVRPVAGRHLAQKMPRGRRQKPPAALATSQAAGVVETSAGAETLLARIEFRGSPLPLDRCGRAAVAQAAMETGTRRHGSRCQLRTDTCSQASERK